MASEGNGLCAAEDGSGGLDGEPDEVGPGGERGLGGQRLEGVDAGDGGDSGLVEERGDEQPRGAELRDGEEEVAAGGEEQFDAGCDRLERHVAGIGSLQPAQGCCECECEFGSLGVAGLGGEGCVCEECAGGLECGLDGGCGRLSGGLRAELGGEGVGGRLHAMGDGCELGGVAARGAEEGDARERLEVDERVGEVDVAEGGVEPDELRLAGGCGGDECCEAGGVVGGDERRSGPGAVRRKGLGDGAMCCCGEC